jgi:DNA-binding NarL/FixJ family response regulator
LTDCKLVLQEALANLTVAIAESDAVVTQDALPMVSGDATQLTQLFQNLIGNALKFREERPPKIHIGVARKNGQEVLAEIKGDVRLKNIPVVILTTSKSQDDISRAYGLHANCYISKPVDFDEFTQVVQRIQDFWFSLVILPSERQ